MFSISCQYALQAILYIALHSHNQTPVGLKEIAESQNISMHFLSKILQNLVRQKILISTKGPKGGFSLNQSPDKLKLITIVEIVDGLDMFDRCGIGLKACSDKTPCPIHFDYKLIKEKIRELLNSKSLSQLCEDINNGQSIVSYNSP